MKTSIYAIYDTRAAEIIGSILQLHKHDAVAIRSFAEVVTTKGTSINSSPDDYQLIRLGTLDTEDGQLTDLGNDVVITARTVLSAQEAVTENE
jgi:hypothetical protein